MYLRDITQRWKNVIPFQGEKTTLADKNWPPLEYGFLLKGLLKGKNLLPWGANSFL